MSNNFDRRSDGSIPEKQDRAGYAKGWVYKVRYRIEPIVSSASKGFLWFTHSTHHRLEDALPVAEAAAGEYAKVKIVQVTSTRVWDSAVFLAGGYE